MRDIGLTAQQLREVLAYDADSGVFTRRVRGKGGVVGGVAGWDNGQGYVHINVLGRRYRAHRLVWLYVFGAWPTADIDHMDGNRSNNRLANLRDVAHGVNQQNQRRKHSHNTSGFLGVSPHRKRWRVQISVDGRCRRLGAFDTPEAAHEVYLEAKRRLHPGCTL